MSDVGFGIYVHWPYCTRKCPYCDFNSHVRAAFDEATWLRAILTELESAASVEGSDSSIVSTVFFGGGTPSLMSGGAVEKILDAVARLWPMANDPEVTLEANPASAEAARFRDYQAAGVNRLSLGMQALNDDDLKFLGRLHTVAEAKRALAAAMSTFDRVSLDLIYARPNQTIAQWRSELGEAIGFGTGHLSLYQLTIEPATPFAMLHLTGALKMPDEETTVSLYEITQELTEIAGLPAYEISNHAREGQEARHNLIYWRYGSYVGVGPGAHGRLAANGSIVATANEKLPERWHDKVIRDGDGLAEKNVLTRHDAAREHLLMSMRLREGLDLDRYSHRWSISFSPERIGNLEQEGLVTLSNGVLAATPRGRLLLNSVIVALAD